MVAENLFHSLSGVWDMVIHRDSAMPRVRVAEKDLPPAEQTKRYGGIQATYLYNRGRVIEPIPPIVHLGGGMRVLLDNNSRPVVLTNVGDLERILGFAQKTIEGKGALTVMKNPLSGDFSPLQLLPDELDRQCISSQVTGVQGVKPFLEVMVPLSFPTVDDIYLVLI